MIQIERALSTDSADGQGKDHECMGTYHHHCSLALVTEMCGRHDGGKGCNLSFARQAAASVTDGDLSSMPRGICRTVYPNIRFYINLKAASVARCMQMPQFPCSS